MTLDMAFFFQILKPGRYLGGEVVRSSASGGTSAREVVWFYPDRYERAMCDPAWRRAFFQIEERKGVRLSRATYYAADVWKALLDSGRPAFSLDGSPDISQAALIVFWAPDALTAARIPSLIRLLRECCGNLTEIGVICDGPWIPRFLSSCVDWTAFAFSGWLPQETVTFIASGRGAPSTVIDAKKLDPAMLATMNPGVVRCEPFHPASTPRWLPRVEVDEEFADVELSEIDDLGVIRPRPVSDIVVDALEGLRTTGIDGIRFCGDEITSGVPVFDVLTELQRRFAMKRVRAAWPAITVEQFQSDWYSYKPHLQRPSLKLRVRTGFDVTQAIDSGARALNSGWQGITLVLEFNSLDSLSRLLPSTRDVLSAWSFAAQGFGDRRPLRVEYLPAPLERWDWTDAVPDDGVKEFIGEFRRFKDDVSRFAAAGGFRIEDLLARNWLAAAGSEIGESLSGLDFAESTVQGAPDFELPGWLRNNFGADSGTKRTPFFIRVSPVIADTAASVGAREVSGSAMDAPAERLFGRRKSKSSTSGRLAPPSATRMRVRWAKAESWRLYSHLDSVRAIERAIRRAGLAASYSEGFHPRLKLSFGPPLAFGLTSEAEYFDLLLEQDYQSTDGERLARNLPEGLRLIHAKGIAAGMPALSDTINEADYSAVIPLELSHAQRMLDEFRSRPGVSWQRIGREDKGPVDPRKTLRDVRVRQDDRGTIWELTVSIGGEGSIRPTDWAMLLFGLSIKQVAELVICRTALNIRRGSTIRTPFDLA